MLCNILVSGGCYSKENIGTCMATRMKVGVVSDLL